ncbi:MAG: Gfo/Idh/MocA family oxidoreductase [Piscinibacter sp.]|nr:Gfo/Idh/MocA family oxidoreductase [Piscinibacter sp.]
MSSPIGLGIIGTGNIFPAYLKTLQRCRRVHLVGIADGDPAVAQRRAAETGVRAMDIDALLASEAQVILNLTPPLAHHAIGRRVLAAGKHLFTEKPLAARFAQGGELVDEARARGLRLGCAPDTFLGAGAQALRALLDAGTIGPVRHGSAHFMGPGPDDWHPNPDFFYREGAGPMLDMGVYYVTHLVHALGPVRSLRGSAHVTRARRTVRSGANAGRTLEVEVPTHLVTLLDFASGAQVVLTTSFDVWRHGHAPIELYGDEGTALGHDPNRFGGTVRYALQRGPWLRAPGGRPYHTNARGIGLIDMVLALQEGRPHRCSDALALHVLEVLDGAVSAGRSGATLTLTTTCDRPEPLAARLF